MPTDNAAAASLGTPDAPVSQGQPPRAWGAKLKHIDAVWVSIETHLAVFIVVVEMVGLCAWVFLKGLASPPTANAAGLVFRAALTATVLGLIARWATRRLREGLRNVITSIAVCAGLFLGRAWVNVGVGYGAELVGWYQDASLLTLVGGLRAVGTRCTIWLAMLGASLATSSGKHINVDVVMRFLPQKARLVAAVSAWSAAALVSLGAAWGFTDHIAITSMGSKPSDPMSKKLKDIAHEARLHWFLFRRQAEIDSKTSWRIFAGTRASKALTVQEWNELIKNGGYEKHFKPEEVKALMATGDPNAHVTPLVKFPDGRSTRGLLVEDLNLLFPFGFFVIALKFILRALLVISGQVAVDPDAAHREEGHEGPPDGPPPQTLLSATDAPKEAA